MRGLEKNLRQADRRTLRLLGQKNKTKKTRGPWDFPRAQAIFHFTPLLSSQYRYSNQAPVTHFSIIPLSLSAQHFLLQIFGHSGVASCWRVCYQRGLPV